MAINYPNFLNAPLLDSPAANIFENVLKGYKMAKEPAKMAEEQKKAELANELSKLDVEHKPKEYELNDEQKTLANAMQSKALENYDEKYNLEKKYKQSQIDKNNRPGGASGLKPNAAVANADYIWKLEHPAGDSTPEEKKEHLEKLKSAFEVGQDSTTANTDRKKQIKNSAFFTSQSAKWKDQQLALAAGLGMDPSAASQAYIDEGKTFSDLAKEKGIDPKSVVPVYPTANENVKQTQIRSSLVSELLNFEKNLVEIQGKYSRKFIGYSPKQIVDALKNENPDEQGMILAARNLAPEVSAIRAKIATNGTIGIEALKELTNKSLGNLKIFEPLVSPEARVAMNKYTDKLIMEAQNAYQNKMQSYSQIQPESGQQSSQANQPNSGFNFSQYPVAGGG